MTDKWRRDTGLVFALVFILLGYWGSTWWLAASAVLIVLVLFVPKALTPLAYLWLKLAEILGFFVNKLFFGLVFFVVVTPVGMLKRLISGDERSFGIDKSRKSAFVERSGTIKPRAIERPY